MLNNEKLSELSNKIREIVKDSPLPDIEKNIDALLKSMFTKMELVTREEFDVQTEVLKRTRQKLEELEKKLGRKPKEDKRGFLLSNGAFVGRKKAAEIAEAAGEVPKKVGKKLHSHDLRKAERIKKVKEPK